jgi:hypothetical protein
MFSTTAAITAGGVPSNARSMMSRVSLGWSSTKLKARSMARTMRRTTSKFFAA